MDSSPPDRARLRNFFNLHSPASNTQDGQQATNDRQALPEMRTGQQTDPLLQSLQWLDVLSQPTPLNSGTPPASDKDDQDFGGDFSLSDLLKSLSSDRIESAVVDGRDLPPLAAAVAVYYPELANQPHARADRVRKLLAEGANPRECDPVFCRSPLHWACIYADPEVVRVICDALRASAPVLQQQSVSSRGSDLNLPDVNGLVPLQALVKLRRAPGHAEIVEYLIGQGADLSCLDKGGTELLFADFLTVDLARVILNQGISVDCRDHLGATPLHRAAMRDDLPLVRFFLDQRADPNARAFLGGTVLNRFGLSLEIVSALLEYGAKVDLSDDLGMTPLMFACHDSNLPLMKLLLAHGASPQAVSLDGMSVLDHARDPETARFLETEAGLAPYLRLADD